MSASPRISNPGVGQVIALVSALVGEDIEAQLSSYHRNAWRASSRYVFTGPLGVVHRFVYGISLIPLDYGTAHQNFRGPFPSPLRG